MRSLTVLFAVLMFSSSALGVAVIDFPIAPATNLGGLYGSGPDTNPELVSMIPFTDPDTGVSGTFTLRVDATVITTATGWTANNSDPNAGLGVITTHSSLTVENDFPDTMPVTPNSPESAKIEDLDIGGVEGLEQLRFRIIDVVASSGSIVATEINSTEATVLTNLDIVEGAALAGPNDDGIRLTATAKSGLNGARITGFSVNITTVPEPSQFMLFGLLGLLYSGRTWWRKRVA